jgi:hypothetical protein
MQKRIIFLALLLSGCTSPKIVTIQKPVMSPPPPCEMMVAGKCKTMTAQEKSGATSLGYKVDEDLPAKASQP